ncbi:CD5 antigen-like, partial [Cetorhinus maximus]
MTGCGFPLPGPVLRGGPNPCSGRVEVLESVSWRRACGQDWDLGSSSVVCRQLWCGAAVSAGASLAPGAGSGSFWSAPVTCSGQEAALSECRTRFRSGCLLSSDAEVTCSGPFQVRLSDGSNVCSGRVEVNYQKAWKPVCGQGWDLKAGDVVCRELSCGRAESVSEDYPGRAASKGLFNGAACKGAERALHQCAFNPIDDRNNANCPSAGVHCSGPVPLRLVGGNNPCSGRVEVYRGGVWGTVCDRGWDLKAAGVACRALNCGTALSAPGGGYYGAGSGVVGLDGVRCLGSEPALGHCPASPEGANDCRHCQDAGATCSGPVPLRLVNGHTVCSGRVEVYRQGTWGTVCDSGWDIKEARVVCRALNCGRALSARKGAYYGQGSGQILLEGVNCLGHELALDRCSHGLPGSGSCTNTQDAGVTCSGPVPVRLVNGSDACSGRVEVHRDGVWGTVCMDGQDGQAASVVCKMLNCGEAQSTPGARAYGEGAGVIGLGGVNCNGTEPSLDQCAADPWGTSNCTHSQDLGVNCS